ARPPGHVRRLAEPPLIDGDAAVLLGEGRRLLPPAQVVAARAVQEEQRGRVAAGVLVVEAEAVLDHERHERSPFAAQGEPPPGGPSTLYSRPKGHHHGDRPA